MLLLGQVLASLLGTNLIIIKLFLCHRSYLKLNNNLDDALEKSEELLRITKRANVDQTVICLDLLASVYNKKRESANEIKCLTSLIQLNHGFLPDLWLRLGESYRYLNKATKINKDEHYKLEFPIFSLMPHRVICGCYSRALVLLKTVEITVSSYSSNANTKLQNYLENEISALASINNITDEELTSIKTEMTTDIFHRYNNSELSTGKNR